MKRTATLFLVTVLMLASLMGSCAAEENSAEEIWIDGSLGKLYGILELPDTDAPFPLIILSHGFDGTHADKQDYADWFVEQGFAVCSLDFCGGGTGSRSAGTMLEMSVLTEAEDLNAVIDHFLGDPRLSCIMLWGSSQGGLVSGYVSAQRPEDIRAVVLEFPAIVIPDLVKEMANPDGSFPESAQLKGVTVGRRYMEDAASVDYYAHIASYTGPVLILHGDEDPLVPLRYSLQAQETYSYAELIVYPRQGHGFTGQARDNAKAAEAAYFRYWSEASEEEYGLLSSAA
ncbi:MAG: lysophospholipase [Oscillospiraceae bacterium]|nr:lysophospholipase [Oscillospiraceae bacterium]